MIYARINLSKEFKRFGQIWLYLLLELSQHIILFWLYLNYAGLIQVNNHLMSDQQLFQQIKVGDPEAFEKLFRSYYDRLIKFVWGYVKSEAIAEEIIQELFTKIWEEGESIEINKSVQNYLYTSARNMSLDYLKHKKVVQNWEQEKQVLRREQPMTSNLEKNLHHKFILGEVEKAIQSLPKRRRMVFILSRYEGMTYREIAEFLGISVNTVETQISRALNTLRNRFQHLLILAAIFLAG